MLFHLVRTYSELKSVNKYSGFIPIVGIALALIVELALGLRGQYVFNPPFLQLGLSTAFVAIEFVISYLSAKGYLFTGSLTLMLIATSFSLVGLASIMNGVLVVFSPN